MTPVLIPAARPGVAARLVLGAETHDYPTIDLALAALRAAEAASVRLVQLMRMPA